MNGEILRLVDTIHRDKDIEKEVIFQGIEAAYLSAVKRKMGESETIRVVIDRLTGETQVVDGESVVPLMDLGRLAALTGKQVLYQRIREAERDKIYAEYEDKLGKLVTGVVQRAEGPNLIVNLGKVEGILPRGEQAPGEKFRVGERIKVTVKDLKKNTNRVKITLSRTSPLLVKALFELEVPEIAEKVIEIMDIVREPGYRTKIAVTTYDHNVDCVGACVGVRGSRIKNIVDELFGEKIDIVRWNESIEVLIMNALKPAEISTMDLDFVAKKALVYVKPDQQSLAIGKRGQNVRLAARLSKWDLDIVTVSDADIEKLRKEEIDQTSEALTAPGEAPAAEGGPEGSSPAAEVVAPGEGAPASDTPGAVTLNDDSPGGESPGGSLAAGAEDSSGEGTDAGEAQARQSITREDLGLEEGDAASEGVNASPTDEGWTNENTDLGEAASAGDEESNPDGAGEEDRREDDETNRSP